MDLPVESSKSESDSDSGVGSPMDEAVTETITANESQEGNSRHIKGLENVHKEFISSLVVYLCYDFQMYSFFFLLTGMLS